MFHLIKLELKKYKLYKYIFFAFLCIIGILTYITITNLFTQKIIERNTTYEMIFWMVDVIVIGTFVIFSAVLITKIIMDEYKNRTILLLFTYPINRKKVILAKLIIVIIFTIIVLLIGNLVCTGYMIILESVTQGIKGNFNLRHFIIVGPIISVIMGIILSLVPFVIGILKKSGIVTIVTAVIIAAFMPKIISKNTNLIINEKAIFIEFAVILIILVISMFYVFKKEINNYR